DRAAGGRGRDRQETGGDGGHKPPRRRVSDGREPTGRPPGPFSADRTPPGVRSDLFRLESAQEKIGHVVAHADDRRALVAVTAALTPAAAPVAVGTALALRPRFGRALVPRVVLGGTCGPFRRRLDARGGHVERRERGFLPMRLDRTLAPFLAAAALVAAPARATLALVLGPRRALRGLAQRETLGLGRTRKRLLHEALDRVEVLLVGRRRQRHRHALAAGPARAADPVHVVLGMGGDVEVEDVAYRRDVEAARGHVGRDEEAKRAVAEAVERLHALALVEVSVDRRGIEAVRLQ